MANVFVVPAAFRNHFDALIGRNIVFGYGKQPKNQLHVLVSHNVDLLDTKTFPKQIDGHTIKYVVLNYPNKRKEH